MTLQRRGTGQIGQQFAHLGFLQYPEDLLLGVAGNKAGPPSCRINNIVDVRDSGQNSSMRSQLSYTRDLLILFGIVFFGLSPLLRSGYFGDDTIASFTGSILAYENIGVMRLTLRGIASWLSGQGRFFPFAWYDYALFTCLDSLIAYKVGTILSVLASDVAFGALVGRLTGSRGMALLAMLLPCALFQFRIYHDPILSFHYLLQFVFLLNMGSLLLLCAYLECPKAYYLILSVVLYAISLMTYEITYVFFFLHIAVAVHYKSSIKRILKVLLPFITLAIFFLGLSILLRARAAGISHDYQIQFDPVIYLKSQVIQASAALPLSYWVFNPSNLDIHSFKWLFTGINYSTVLAATALAFLFFRYIREVDAKGRRPRGALIVLAALLLVLPGVMIALSPKYQCIPLGLGYLPVYIQYFGVAVLLLELVFLAIRSARSSVLKNGTLVILSVLLAGVFVVNYNTNRVVVEEENKVLLYPRDIFDRAIRNGLLAEIPDGSTLVASPEFFWNDKYFVYGGSGKRLSVMNLPPYYRVLASSVATRKSYSIRNLSGQNVYFIKYDSDGLGRGYVALGKAESVVLDHTAGAFAEIRVASLSVFTDNTTEKVVVAKPLGAPSAQGAPCLWDIPSVGNGSRTDGLFSAHGLLKGECLDFLSLTITSRNDPAIDGLAVFCPPLRSHTVSGCVFLADGNRQSSVVLGTETFLTDLITEDIVGIQRSKRAPLNERCAEDQTPVYTYRPAAELSPSFSIEILVKAEPGQTPFANLISNHPGLTNFEGLTIEQDGTRDNCFRFVVADGREWVPQLDFSLPAREWTYLAINFRDGVSTLYINGSRVGSSSRSTSFVNSEMPLTIGDWVNGDRTFRGAIREVALGNGQLSETGVRQTWEAFEAILTTEGDK